jgi:uncharacterized phage-associated protein
MAHDIRVLGNRFVYLGRKHDYRLTSVGLQKFIFLAHGWHMGLHGIENRLLDDRVEVWRLGPVAPSGYRAFRGLGHVKRKYAKVPDEVKSELNEVELKTCDFVMKRYGHLSPFELTLMTHKKGSPWHKHRHDKYSEIPREDIFVYYNRMAVLLGMIPETEATT